MTKTAKQPEPLNAIDRLGLRVTTMIQHPIAQLNGGVVVHRLDTDPDYAWQAILELIKETDGIEMEEGEGLITLKWDLPSDDDTRLEAGEIEALEDAAPF